MRQALHDTPMNVNFVRVLLDSSALLSASKPVFPTLSEGPDRLTLEEMQQV